MIIDTTSEKIRDFLEETTSKAMIVLQDMSRQSGRGIDEEYQFSVMKLREVQESVNEDQALVLDLFIRHFSGAYKDKYTQSQRAKAK